MAVLDIIYYSLITTLLAYVPIILQILLRLFGITFTKLDSITSRTYTDNLAKLVIKKGKYMSKYMKDGEIIPGKGFFFLKKPFIVGWMAISIMTSDRCNQINYEIYYISFIDLVDILEKKDTKGEEEEMEVNLWEPDGHPWCSNFIKTDTYKEPLFIPHKKLIDEIVQIYKTISKHSLDGSAYLGVFLYGIPGLGKSTLGKNLALCFGTNLLKRYNPTRPGPNINSFFKNVKFTKEKPVIIMIDEYDRIVKSCYEESVKRSTEYYQEVYDKNTLNNFIDSLTEKKGVILLCTSNNDKDWFDSNDCSSAIRCGRFSVRRELDLLTSDEVDQLKRLGYTCKSRKLSDITYSDSNKID